MPRFRPAPPSTPQTPQDLLHYLYADLRRLEHVSSPTIVLHRHDKRLPALRGIAAAQAHEEELVAATGGTLEMDVERIVLGEGEGEGGQVNEDGVEGEREGKEEENQEKGGKEEKREEYATVYGWIRARKPGVEDLDVRFRGVWRFGSDGRAVEHWENVEGGDEEALGRWLVAAAAVGAGDSNGNGTGDGVGR